MILTNLFSEFRKDMSDLYDSVTVTSTFGNLYVLYFLVPRRTDDNHSVITRSYYLEKASFSNRVVVVLCLFLTGNTLRKN